MDDEGRLKPGVNLSGFRSLVKRTAVMMHALGRRPLSWIHMTNATVVLVLSFGAVNLDWEWRDLGKQAGVDIQDRLGIDRDPSLVLVQSTGLQAGNVPVAIDRLHARARTRSPGQMRTGLAVGLPETATATDLERAAAARQRKKAVNAAELAAELDAELDGQDPSGRLARIAPGVFELTIQKHDFALILVE